MDLHDFTNRAKVLRSIDLGDLTDAGIILSVDGWADFRSAPIAWLMIADDETAAKLWALVESRCKPADPNETPHVLDGKLEPEAKNSAALGITTMAEGAALSAAISLKRIADALAPLHSMGSLRSKPPVP